MAARAIVSLGSNIEPRAEYLARAIEALSALPETRLFKAGPVEETEPVDVPAEFARMKFLNQIVIFDTSLEVHDFSRRMHAIEDALGRVRTVRNGPRTIDIPHTSAPQGRRARLHKTISSAPDECLRHAMSEPF